MKKGDCAFYKSRSHLSLRNIRATIIIGLLGFLRLVRQGSPPCFWVRTNLMSLYLGTKRHGTFSSRILFNSGGQPRNGKILRCFGGLWGFSDQQFLWECVLNENGPDWFIYVNVGSPVDKTAWEGLGSVAVWEKRCHWGWAWRRFRKLMPFPASSLSACGSDISSQLLFQCYAYLLIAIPPTMIVMDSTL